MINLVDDIIAHEQGELDLEGTLNLFSHLVATGMAWSLQGHYGHTAAAMIEHGLLEVDGTVTDLGRDF